MDINSLSSPAAVGSAVTTGNKPEAAASQPMKQSEGSMASVDQKTNPIPEVQIQNEIQEMNRVMELMGLGVAFTIDDQTKSSVVNVIDKSTDEVIKQFPNESALKMMRNIQEYLNTVNEQTRVTKEGLTGTLLNEII